MSLRFSLLSRLSSKVVHELLPAAFASVVGAVMFNYYTHTLAGPSATATGSPTSVEMMQIVRDEHSLIVDYLKRRDDAEHKKIGAAEEELSKSKALQRASLLDANEIKAARSKALTIVQDDKAKSPRKITALHQRRERYAGQNPLQLNMPSPSSVIEASDHPIPPAPIPLAASNFSDRISVAQPSSLVATIERIRLWFYAG